MTEKQFIEALKKIKEHCTNTCCPKCVLKTADDWCLTTKITMAFNTIPMKWKIKNIEKLIKSVEKLINE